MKSPFYFINLDKKSCDPMDRSFITSGGLVLLNTNPTYCILVSEKLNYFINCVAVKSAH